MYVGYTINDTPLWIFFHHSDQWHPVGSLRSSMMGILINHGNWQILHIRVFMLSHWYSSLKKMFDKMLIIQIKFKTYCVSRCCIMNNTQKIENSLSDLKIVIHWPKKKKIASLSLMTKGSADMHLCGFPFILVVNINWNNRCLFLLELCQLQPLVSCRYKRSA